MALLASWRLFLMAIVRSFPPILGPRPRVLVLGSMPGVASLEAGQYYAHPRNAFWPIMGELCGFDAAVPYRRRCAALKRAGIAVWDVLGACERPGSLDSAIVADTEEPNDLIGLFTEQRSINRVVFNGGKAEQAFRRHVLAELPDGVEERVALGRAPSTSPANAGQSFAQKRAAWRGALTELPDRHAARDS